MAPSRILRRAALAAVAALALSSCAIQLQSRPDPTVGDDTMLIGADTGAPFFEENFNPYLGTKRIGVNYLFEPLLLVDPISGQEHDWLAESTEVPDPSTIVFDLRDGVTWSDGEPFTEDDVAFTFDLLQQVPAFDGTGIWSYIDSYETGDGTVTVHLKEPDVPARVIIGGVVIVPEHQWADVENPDSFRNTDPIGTGPYTLGNFTPQQYSMDKNHDYWQADEVAAEHLILPAANSDLDVVTKGYDWAFKYMSNVEGTWLAASDTNSYFFPPGGTIALFPNHTREPFDDVRVRQALSLALDRRSIADLAAEGYMDPASMSGLLLPNQEEDLDPSLPDQGFVEQDRDRALELLAEAGWTLQGDRLVDESGQQLAFTITTANGYADWLRAVQEVERQFEAIGIDVSVDQPQPAGHTLAQRNGDFDLIVSSFGGTGTVYQDFNNNLSGEFFVPEGEETGNNFGRYRNDEVDAILREYRVTTDETRLRELAWELENVFYDDVPVIGMYYGGSWGLFSDRKFTGWPSEEDRYSPITYMPSALLVLTSLERVRQEGDD
ncbi:ABC transporter substrate-binding protein [Arenivirga flava]|uniref:Peptide ABC transporter substrate-binding protein n=1 Tax=Arenivirga flava TaxID=1930060 RepID=A0AA37XAM9_9MICO|nr:ABC transporter substrate-binding protein [Arenivirga flava]GMA27748.1 peptide ABC transporter substrate-binding protein [Arenivirga flava]